MPQPDEFINVELVVGEQQEVLKVVGCGTGVMAQALQRIVHPRRGEQGQWLRLARARFVGAVGNAVVHGRQVGQVKHIAHQLAALRAQTDLHMVLLGKREMHRDRLRTGAHFQLDPVVLHQQGELLQVIVGIQVGARQRGFITARAGNKTIAQPSIFQRA